MSFPPFPPGPGKVQTQPRPHQVVIDPTGQYILVPDLGADRIRVLKMQTSEGVLLEAHECGGIDLPKGSFPRHVVFVTLGEKTMLYLLCQDTYSLITYSIEYLADNQGLAFHKEGQDINLLQREDTLLEPPPSARILASHLALSVSYPNTPHFLPII